MLGVDPSASALPKTNTKNTTEATEDHVALLTQSVVDGWSIPRKTGRDCIERMTPNVREQREDSQANQGSVCPEAARQPLPGLRADDRGGGVDLRHIRRADQTVIRVKRHPRGTLSSAQAV